jgi:hypothetical protein
MFRVRCSNPQRNPENDPNQTGCPAPNGKFEFNDHRYTEASPAEENELDAYSIVVTCPYCHFQNTICIKGGPTNAVYGAPGEGNR